MPDSPRAIPCWVLSQSLASAISRIETFAPTFTVAAKPPLPFCGIGGMVNCIPIKGTPGKRVSEVYLRPARPRSTSIRPPQRTFGYRRTRILVTSAQQIGVTVEFLWQPILRLFGDQAVYRRIKVGPLVNLNQIVTQARQSALANEKQCASAEPKERLASLH